MSPQNGSFFMVMNPMGSNHSNNKQIQDFSGFSGLLLLLTCGKTLQVELWQPKIPNKTLHSEGEWLGIKHHGTWKHVHLRERDFSEKNINKTTSNFSASFLWLPWYWPNTGDPIWSSGMRVCEFVGWTNPVEKYESTWKSSPMFEGENKTIFEKSPPSRCSSDFHFS